LQELSCVVDDPAVSGLNHEAEESSCGRQHDRNQCGLKGAEETLQIQSNHLSMLDVMGMIHSYVL